MCTENSIIKYWNIPSCRTSNRYNPVLILRGVYPYIGSQMPFSVPDLTNMVQQLRDLYVSLHFEKQLPHTLQRALRDTKPTVQVVLPPSPSLSHSLTHSLTPPLPPSLAHSLTPSLRNSLTHSPLTYVHAHFFPFSGVELLEAECSPPPLLPV